MDTNGSFYVDGLVYSETNPGLGNVPSTDLTPNTAESSFYQNGQDYIEANPTLAAASATAAAASAAAAAATLANAMLKANNLSDVANVAASKINLALVKADVGLGNVDNTSDANKPVSTAQAAADALKANITYVDAADALKANIASPTFTGVPAAPTAAAATSTTQLATTAFVTTADNLKAATTYVDAADALKANIASPTFTGVPAAPTAAAATNTTQLATTAFVTTADNLKANLASPTFTGTVTAAAFASTASGTNVLGDVYAARTGTSGAVFFGSTSANYIYHDGTQFNVAGGAFINFPMSGAPTAPTAAVGTNTTQVASTAFVLANAAPRSFLAGLELSTAGSSTSFSVAVGTAVDSTNVVMMKLASVQTRTYGAWAAPGSGGCLDTGTATTLTWYHVYVIMRPDTGVVDIAVSLSASAPTFGGNIPAAYTRYRRIGAIRINGSSNWDKFKQDGDTFNWDVPFQDITAANPGTAAVTRTVTTPLGVRVEGIFNVGFGASALADNPGALFLSDLSIADTAPSGFGSFFCYSATALINNSSGVVRTFTNTSSQVRSRLQISSTNTTLYITTFGWVDRRGRDS